MLAPGMGKQLRSRISDLAASFIDSVLEAVRTSSLEDILGGGVSLHVQSNGRAASSAGRAARATAPSGRLPRRSAEDIAKTLEIVVSLLGSRKSGLRAEQIRTELNLQAKELPRILKEGLARKKLRTVGQKRATTYFVK